MNPQQELENGTLLQGRFKVIKSLGQGGFGITYKAENISLGNTVCIKELFIGGNSTRSANNTVQSQGLKEVEADYFKKRFIDEARGLAKFNNPGIVRVTDVFEENNTAYFVMDFVNGQTLKDMVSKQGALPSEKAIALILHLLDAVEAVHSQGILHRDIKPDNILITPEGKSVLIDFGSAREFAEGYTTTQTAILTPGYAPLEQYSDKAKRGPYTDIYALGATIYFVLTGVKPIAATDRNFEALASPETINPAVSKTLASVVMLAMNLKQEDRFQTIAQMREALQSQEKEAKSNQNQTKKRIEIKKELPKPIEQVKSDEIIIGAVTTNKSKKWGIGHIALLVTGVAFLIIIGYYFFSRTPAPSMVVNPPIIVKPILPKEYQCKSTKAYFYNDSKFNSKTNAFLVAGDIITIQRISTDQIFGYGEFINYWGKQTNGWLEINDLQPKTITKNTIPGKYPLGSQRKITYNDIDGLNQHELLIFKNEIYARNGYKFSLVRWVVDYFNEQSWYVNSPHDNKDPNDVYRQMSSIEKYNIEFLGQFITL